MTDRLVTLSADFLCAMVALGDKDFREGKARTHPWRAHQPGQLQRPAPKPRQPPGRMR